MEVKGLGLKKNKEITFNVTLEWQNSEKRIQIYCMREN